MKIAIVHYAVFPVLGGVEQVIAAHRALLERAGHAVFTVAQRGEADVRLPRGADVATYHGALREVLTGCDVVIVHNVLTMPFDLPLTEALRALPTAMPRTRLVAWVHDVAACNPDLAPVSEMLRASAPGYEYIAVSAARAEQCRTHLGVDARVIANGVEPAAVLGLPERVVDLARRYHLLDARTVLLHPTRLLRRKNVELGLAVLGAWRDAGRKATLLVTGAEDPHNPASREYVEFLRTECVRLGLGDAVIFVGDHFAVSDLDLAGLYRLADALFFPSRQEGFGLPVLEAALHRLPAFVSDLPTLRELEVAGAHYISPDADATVLAARMGQILDADAAFQARRAVLSQYAWRSVERVMLAWLGELNVL